MNDTPTLALASHKAARPGTPRRHYSLATLRSIVATWSERIRFRWELEQKLKHDPHLIDDIGLTRQQVEAEIAKPFWQVSNPL
ncbi:hypothetical protein ILFOPFJJ_04783 [Ensifer psoraleae]|uniref:DUF1127 domain-containing protein n=1 Tax=Sinorhizobium psoraleae TaxID=520838 RepID=UPI001567E949|nr:DUF1127 domain-containing protein [Sinorhizobium psoraleae]NRP73865.1 hypothetical protein [Sinorhizobium psoraleae]